MAVLWCRYRHDNALRRHFQKQHFLCDQGDCRHREPDYAAYRDAISLRAHQLAAHVEKGSLSQAQLKQMARVDLSVGFFDHRLPQGGGQQGGRERQGRREDEYTGRVDGPDYAHDDDGDEEEQYPSLPSTLEQRARQANSNIPIKADKKERVSSSTAAAAPTSAAGGTSMQRSYSQPYGLAGRRFDGNDFPSLSSGTPTSSSSTLPAASPASFVGRPGAPPNPSDFPTLKQTVKTDKKLRALKEKEKERPAIAPTPVHSTPVPYSAAMQPSAVPPRSASASPIPVSAPSSSPSSYPDTRIMSHVPLPLPSPAPAADVANRNKQLITEIRSSLSADEFDSFRIQSSAYRMGDLTASSYLQFFYGLMRGHESESRVEQLLMELIALLPDDAKRKELHGEYAKHKVWEKIAKMKGGKDGAKMEVVAKAGGGGGGGGVESFQGVAVRELRRPVVDDKRGREERERVDREEKEKELERKREERKRTEEQAKADKQEKLRQLREERLKEEEKERRDKERSEKAEKTRQDEEDRAAEESRRQKEQRDKDDADSARQHQVLNGRAERPPSKFSTAAAPRGGTMWTSASPSAADDDDDYEPAFPSATATLGSYSSTSSLSNPALIDTYLGNINQLSTVLPHTMLGSLHFLSNLLLTVTAVLSARHPPSLLSPSLRRFHPSDDTRKRLTALASRLRLSSALEFGRLTQLGVLPQSIYTLSQCVSLWRRQGGSDDGGGEEVRGVCEGMTSGELVVLYEWLHAVLGKLTDEQSEDVQAAIERQRRKGEREEEVTVDGERRLVPLKKDEDDGDERKGGGTGAGGAGGGKKKKSKQLLFYYGGSGLSGVS